MHAFKPRSQEAEQANLCEFEATEKPCLGVGGQQQKPTKQQKFGYWTGVWLSDQAHA